MKDNFVDAAKQIGEEMRRQSRNELIGCAVAFFILVCFILAIIAIMRNM